MILDVRSKDDNDWPEHSCAKVANHLRDSALLSDHKTRAECDLKNALLQDIVSA
jgi:hypothetical protein